MLRVGLLLPGCFNPETEGPRAGQILSSHSATQPSHRLLLPAAAGPTDFNPCRYHALHPSIVLTFCYTASHWPSSRGWRVGQPIGGQITFVCGGSSFPNMRQLCPLHSQCSRGATQEKDASMWQLLGDS